MTRLTKAAQNGQKEKVKEFIQACDNINEKDGVYNCHYHLFLTYIFVTCTNMSICTSPCVCLYTMTFLLFHVIPIINSFFLSSFLSFFLSFFFLSFFLSYTFRASGRPSLFI